MSATATMAPAGSEACEAEIDARSSILFTVTTLNCVHAKRSARDSPSSLPSELWVRIKPQEGIKVASITEAEDTLLARRARRIQRPVDAATLVYLLRTEVADDLTRVRMGLASNGLRKPFNYILMHPDLFEAMRPWGRWTPLNATQGPRYAGRWRKLGGFGAVASIYTSDHLSPDEFFVLYKGHSETPRLLDGPAVVFNAEGSLTLAVTPTTPVTRGSIDDYIHRIKLV